jgi:hypothetical protein
MSCNHVAGHGSSACGRLGRGGAASSRTYDGRRWVIAVNGTDSPVTALGGGAVTARDGDMRDTFAPYAVHIDVSSASRTRR